MFLTMKVLENTPAVLSLGKLCDEHGYSYEWIKNQKPHLILNGIGIQCNTENFVPIVVPNRLIIPHLHQARLLHQPQLRKATVRLEQRDTYVGQIPVQYLCQMNMLNAEPKPNKSETTIERCEPLYSEKTESHSSSSSFSSSPSSPAVGEISVREKEDAPDSDISSSASV